jgi:hypothetical protein
MNEKEKLAFFANRPKPHVVHMGGKKLALANLPKEIQQRVMIRLAEKDEVMAQGLKGILPGIKIDGKQVTRDNIHEFEKGYKKGAKAKVDGKDLRYDESKKEWKEEKKVETPTEKAKYVKEDLEGFSFSRLKRIAKKFGETGRSKVGLIKDILKHN